MELSYKQYSELMDQLVAEGYDVLEASEMIFGYLDEEPKISINSLNTPSIPRRRGAVGYRNRIASLPPSARQVTQYPAGVPTGMGGGNAGASTSRPTPRVVQTSTPGTRLTASSRPPGTSPATPIARSAYSTPAPSGGSQQQKPLVGGIERRTPTSAELKAAQALRAPVPTTGPLGAAVAAAGSKPVAFDPSSSTSTPTDTSKAYSTPAPSGGYGGTAGASKPTTAFSPTSTPTAPAAPARPSLRSGLDDIRRMQQASQMRQKGITITSDQIKAAERTKPTTPSLGQKASGLSLGSSQFKPTTPGAKPTTPAAATPATPALGTSTPAMQSAGTAAASKPTTTGVSGFKMSTDLSKPAETKKNQQKINAGMEIQGSKLQEQLKTDSYGSYASPDSLFEAYQSIYNQ